MIRRASPDDAPEIARLANRLAELTTDDGPGEMTAEAVIRDILDPAHGLACDVAIADGRVAGYAMHHVAYETAYAARGRYLSDIFVDDWARGRGLGRALIRNVAREAAAGGGVFIWWMAKETGPEAKALYKSIADISDAVIAHAATESAFDALLD